MVLQLQGALVTSPKVRSFPIYVAHCSRCDLDFLYTQGINSVKSRNSDIYGIPRCPSCSSFQHTTSIGGFRAHVWSIKKTL